MGTARNVTPLSTADLRGLLVDCDGTLVGTDAVVHSAWRELQEEYACHGIIHQHDLSDPHPMSSRKNAISICRETKTVNQRHVELRIEEVFLEHLDGAYFHWDVIDAVKSAVAHGVRVAVVSNSGRDHVRRVLMMSGLLGIIHAFIANEDVAQCKPNPEPYLRALNGLAVNPSSAIAIEDSHAGAISALAAGIPTALLEVKNIFGLHNRKLIPLSRPIDFDSVLKSFQTITKNGESLEDASTSLAPGRRNSVP